MWYFFLKDGYALAWTIMIWLFDGVYNIKYGKYNELSANIFQHLYFIHFDLKPSGLKWSHHQKLIIPLFYLLNL